MRNSAIFVTVISLLTLASGRSSHALTLQEGLGIVTSEGREVRIASMREAAADANVLLARSRRLPSVETYADHTWLKYQPEGRFGSGIVSPLGDRQSLRYGIRVNQLLTDFGRTGSAIRGTEATALVKALTTRKTRNDASLDFFLVYVSLLQSNRLLAVANEEVKRFEAHLSDARALYEEGMVTVNDTLLAEVNLADALQRQITTKNDRDLQISRVNFLILRPLSDPVDAREITRGSAVDFPDPAEATRIAEGRRVELQILDQEISNRNALLDAARADHYPTAFISGGYDFEENSYRVHEDNLSLTAGLTWDLYSGGAKSASILRAEAELAALRMERVRLAEFIGLEVKDAYLALNGARERAAVNEKAVRQAKESLRIQRTRYEEGEGTSTEVTDAVTLLSRTEQNYWTALYTVHAAEANILYTIGEDLVQVFND